MYLNILVTIRGLRKSHIIHDKTRLKESPGYRQENQKTKGFNRIYQKESGALAWSGNLIFILSMLARMVDQR